jgi:hypothetical protein
VLARFGKARFTSLCELKVDQCEAPTHHRVSRTGLDGVHRFSVDQRHLLDIRANEPHPVAGWIEAADPAWG